MTTVVMARCPPTSLVANNNGFFPHATSTVSMGFPRIIAMALVSVLPARWVSQSVQSLNISCLRRLKLGNACYHSVQNLLSSSLLSKNLNIKIYRTIILPFVLYGCETWSLTLREEHRLRVFENRVLRRIFGSKRDGVTGEWRKLHNEELNDLYSSPNIVRLIISRRMRWRGMWHV